MTSVSSPCCANAALQAAPGPMNATIGRSLCLQAAWQLLLPAQLVLCSSAGEDWPIADVVLCWQKVC